MNVLVLAPYPRDTSPGQRYRIEQWMPWLERKGVRFEFDAFMSEALEKVLYQPGHTAEKARHMLVDYGRRLVRMVRLGAYDAIYLAREAALVGPALIERLLALKGIPMVYDFDDAIYVPYISPTNRYFSYLKMPGKTATICRLSAHVVVGNSVLRDYAVQHNPNVSIVPTTIDTEKYNLNCQYAVDDTPVIGWTGSHSSVQYLELLRPVFAELAKRHRFRLQVIGASFEMSGIDVVLRKWNSSTEAEDLSNVHIGVMPLVDDVWTRGKCACKALQYMALGIPTVVSPVGTNSDVIRDGVNGQLASTNEEWVTKLSALLEREELRRRLGTAGKRTVEEAYSARVQAPRILSILEKVAST
jgi:glycosyltransferase involved in cell wall biosynthesis